MTSIVLCGCGSSLAPDDAGVAPMDVAVETSRDAGNSDANDAGCWGRTFGAPTPITELNTSDHERYMRLTPDELTAYFDGNENSDGGVSIHLFTAKRASRLAPFSPRLPVPGDAPAPQHYWTNPTVTADQLLLIFYEDYAGARLLWTRRGSTQDPFATPSVVPGTSAAGDPFVTADGQRLYVASNGIMQATLGPNGVTNPRRVWPFTIDAFAFAVSSDELTIYFASICSSCGPGAQGDYDIWSGTRPSINDEFSDFQNVIEVNSPGRDFPSWISPDGCRLYLSSIRGDGGGHFDLYVAER